MSPQLLTSGVTIDSFSTQALLPDRSVARPTDAWTCWSGRSNPTVIFDEVVVLYDPSWGEANTALAFRRAMQQRVGSEIVDIDGHAAFVDHGSEKTPIGTLLTVVDGVMVSMYNTADADGHSLLRFASSLVEANS